MITKMILCSIIFYVLGFITSHIRSCKFKKYDGELIIDTTNPNKDVFRFELYYSPETLTEKTDILFKVVRDDS